MKLHANAVCWQKLPKCCICTSVPDCIGPSSARRLTVTRVFQDGVELNWLPPNDPNGEVHYVIFYTPEGSTEHSVDTGSDLTHYNLTGLERNSTYNISVQAVNSAGRSGIRQNAVVTNYSHTVPVGEPAVFTAFTFYVCVTAMLTFCSLPHAEVIPPSGSNEGQNAMSKHSPYKHSRHAH